MEELELSKFPAIIIALVVAAILLGVGVAVLQKFGDATQGTTIAYNQTITLATSSAVALAYNDLTEAAVYIRNGTGVNNQNWDVNVTVQRFDGTITLLSAYSGLNGQQAQVNYTYYGDTATATAMEGYNTGFSSFKDWFAILVVVVITGLVVGLVINHFKGEGGE